MGAHHQVLKVLGVSRMVAKMGTPTRRNVWLFDELTEEFSEDIPNPLVTSNESLAAPSNPVVELDVEPESVETTPDAPLTVSIQEELFLQSVFDHVSSSFPELALTMAVNGCSGSPVSTITQKKLFNHPPFGLTSHIQVVIQYKCYTASVLMKTWKVGK